MICQPSVDERDGRRAEPVRKQVVEQERQGGGQELVTALPQLISRPSATLDQPCLLVLGGLERDLRRGGGCASEKLKVCGARPNSEVDHQATTP